MNSTPMRVAVIGLRRQGVVGAACLAEWGHQVVAADHDYEWIRSLAEGRAGLSEPGLDELIQLGIKSGHLSFTNNLEAAVAGCRAVFLMHDTSVEGRDGYDLSALLRALTDMAPGLAAGVIILVTAQVPVGTTAELGKLLQQLRPGLGAHLAYAPENMPEGSAVAYFRQPPFPVLGAEEAETFSVLETLFQSTGASWHRCDVRTAEMVRYALHGYLAVTTCFANELGNLCGTVGADSQRLATLLRLDPRIGCEAPLIPGPGFSGGSLARDLQALRHLGVSAGLPTALLDGAWTSNGQVRR